MAIKVVCFDLGGVLVRICRSFEEACAAADVPYRAAERVESEEWRKRRRRLQDQHQSGLITSAEFYQDSTIALENTYSKEEVERIHRAWVKDEFDGVPQLVQSIQHDGRLRTACLSNINDAHWRLIAGQGEASRYPGVMQLDRQLLSHQMGHIKPNREIYRLAAEEFGVAPDATAFFDDLVENVEAAKSFGWRAFHVDHTRDTPAQIREGLASLGVAPSD